MNTNIKCRIIFNRRKTATPASASPGRKGSVEIEISDAGRRRWVSTGIKLHLDQWRDGMVVNHLDALELNMRIRQMYEDIASNLRADMGLNSIPEVQARNKDFLDWMEKEILERTDIVEGTRSAHLRTVESLRSAGIRYFSDLTEANITRWDRLLKKKLRTQSAVHGYHKRLKVYVSRALHLGLLKESPYRFVKVPRGRSEGVKYLTPEERRPVSRQRKVTAGAAAL